MDPNPDKSPKKGPPDDVIKKIMDKEPIGRNDEGSPAGGVPPKPDKRNSGESGGRTPKDDGDEQESV